ncbi:MAG TPA: tRNA uridine-5-carboxymethylaminomethyl(34) synthesis GTPase MnmE, partial [Rhodospirillaceae bacterium]|nr:tRNA uridine-5-carboxymethylaminomethyl(34) synthesis GTPase MnmE [Rhodospirillaceae bacterium]
MTGSTIFALSSGRGRAGIAVWRVSGPLAGPIVQSISGVLPSPRTARLRTFRDETGLVMDQGLVLWFPGPHSETGEDLAEFHGHGGRALMLSMTRAFQHLGAVPAGPGDFTRRAVLTGKLDLTQAEALLDLVNADTEHQRQRALAQAGGALAALVGAWRQRLVRAMGHLEALIDFPDEEIPPAVEAGLTDAVTSLR